MAETQKARVIVADVLDGTTVVGRFSGAIVTRFGVRMLGSSFPGWTTPYVGFNLREGYARLDALRALERFAFGELGVLHLEVSDRGFVPEDGAAGSVFEGMSHLNCTIDPAEIKQKAGGGADCKFDPGASH